MRRQMSSARVMLCFRQRAAAASIICRSELKVRWRTAFNSLVRKLTKQVGPHPPVGRAVLTYIDGMGMDDDSALATSSATASASAATWQTMKACLTRRTTASYILRCPRGALLLLLVKAEGSALFGVRVHGVEGALNVGLQPGAKYFLVLYKLVWS